MDMIPHEEQIHRHKLSFMNIMISTIGLILIVLEVRFSG
jgi:hypothetical protein